MVASFLGLARPRAQGRLEVRRGLSQRSLCWKSSPAIAIFRVLDRASILGDAGIVANVICKCVERDQAELFTV